MKKALIIVDVQNDFCPGGPLPSPAGHEIIARVNKVMPQFELVIASKDWHPRDTVHFQKWPVHCVRDTPGANFHPALDVDQIDLVLLKGTENVDDGYSAFEATNHNLADFLRMNQVEELYVCGLTTEYCVKATAEDALKNGFKAFVIRDATGPVAAKPGDEKEAYEAMLKEGVSIIDANEIV